MDWQNLFCQWIEEREMKGLSPSQQCVPRDLWVHVIQFHMLVVWPKGDCLYFLCLICEMSFVVPLLTQRDRNTCPHTDPHNPLSLPNIWFLWPGSIKGRILIHLFSTFSLEVSWLLEWGTDLGRWVLHWTRLCVCCKIVGKKLQSSVSYFRDFPV